MTPLVSFAPLLLRGALGQTVVTLDDVDVEALEDLFAALPPPPSPSSTAATAATAPPTISGLAFFDLDADGVRGADAVLEYGVGDVPVWLFSCDPGDDVFPLLQTTKTDGGGYYSFGSLHAGDGRSYYVNVQPPSWYALTPAWGGGEVDAKDDADIIVSAVNPSTGNTPCFELTTYATIVNFGLVFDVVMQPTTDLASGVPPTTDDPASPPPSSPSKGPSASPVEEVDVSRSVVVFGRGGGGGGGGGTEHTSSWLS